ncbi:hypothetical protein CHARACLAT_029563 [Characodon lateralis]|uniref:Uncharacterized protein n=1 Tax=Characodon lateralis TaxID=208331 RepID=A0ABU7E4W8_9TELE|nr:hypothetical protein [Characodon lateralis]
MRMLWIYFMLLGSITCAPPKPDGEQPTWWTVVSPSQQEPSKPVYQNPSGQVGGSVGHSSYPGIHYSSSTGGASSGPTYGVQHAGHQHSQHATPGDSSSQFAEESWSSSSDTSGADEPVFSPVDEEDQVHQCFPIIGKFPIILAKRVTEDLWFHLRFCFQLYFN